MGVFRESLSGLSRNFFVFLSVRTNPIKDMEAHFATHYFTRYKVLPPFFEAAPDQALGLVVIIPCIDDAFIFNTLDSLEAAFPVEEKIEVIVNVNSGEMASPEVVGRNRLIFDELKQKAETAYYSHFRLLPLLLEGTVKKKAGVGFARRVAMDEAVRRLAAVNRPDGLIVSLDADALVAREYFLEIVRAAAHRSAKCFTFQFQHDYNAERYSSQVIDACRLYEIYLRYYRLALKTFDFPFAIHTIGSCFAIRADAYIKLGGMTPRQGGEDFYFLQKAVKMHPVYEVVKPIVFPSPRISNRVPFGTGPSVRHIIEAGTYNVYNFELFHLLKDFYALIPAMEREEMKAQVPREIMSYLGESVFDEILSECRHYSASSNAFIKRMYDRFDAFFIVKFLNTFNHSPEFPPVDVLEAGRILLDHYGVTPSADLYEEILSLDISR